MSRKRDEDWKVFVLALSPEQQYKLLLVAIKRLIEMEEISYRKAEPDEELSEDIYWDSCGESLLEE